MNIKTGIAAYAFIVMSAAAQGPTPKAASKVASTKPAADSSKFKAIWERVPFNKDINLNAIACAGPETCWAVGDKSTIIHTTDGGKTWQVQLGGDPQAAEDDLERVFFLDAKHGWAMTDRAKILGTRDGSTWAELSSVSGTTKGFWFVSPQTGFEMESPGSPAIRLQRTGDGGKTWKPASERVLGGHHSRRAPPQVGLLL
ncbi:MAG: WD40/YVTN/BNR-like repeat-containing protein [Bryobacteraceae bacterium]